MCHNIFCVDLYFWVERAKSLRDKNTDIVFNTSSRVFLERSLFCVTMFSVWICISELRGQKAYCDRNTVLIQTVLFFGKKPFLCPKVFCVDLYFWDERPKSLLYGGHTNIMFNVNSFSVMKCTYYTFHVRSIVNRNSCAV